MRKKSCRRVSGDGKAEDLIPAVGYLRMSDDDQEGSIEQQRAAITAWAAGKYRILRWYVDPGKSGSKDQEKRVEFRRMILDSSKGDFQAILCWKTNRFARLDSQEGAEAKLTLRRNGVYLDTVQDGKLDWDTMEGRIVDTVRAEMDHAYSRSLASDSLRGRLAALEQGDWPNGSVPYGYYRRYVAPDGREMLLKRTEPFRKPQGWRLVLVVCDEEAKVVRWIFERFTWADVPLGVLALELNQRGVPSPATLGKGTGKGWTVRMVRLILTNPAYMGLGYLGGRGSQAGHFETAKEACARGAFELLDGVRKAGVCPVLVEPATWQRAQDVLAGRAGLARRPRERSGALSGIVVCGCCGYRMVSSRYRGRLAYLCQSASLRPGLTRCRKWQVHEDELLPRLCAKLVEVVDAELVRGLAARLPASRQLGDLDMARQRLAELEKTVAEARRRYLKAPAELMPGLEETLAEMYAERAELEERARQLSAEANEGAVTNFARWWEGVRGTLLLVPLAAEQAGTQGQAARERLCELWLSVRDRVPAEVGEPASEGMTVGMGLEAPGGVEGQGALVEPAALRALLVRLGVKVECFFAAADRRKATPGRGRGPSWALARAVLSWKPAAGEDQTKGDTCLYNSPSVWNLPPGAVDLLAYKGERATDDAQGSEPESRAVSRGGSGTE